ncbi:hypothetical protein C1N58_15135 [Pantoea sp. SGAir0180]
MKIAVFLIVLLAVFILVPDSWIHTLLMSHITLAGNGKEAIDSYSFTLNAVKFALSFILASLAMLGCPKRRR